MALVCFMGMDVLHDHHEHHSDGTDDRSLEGVGYIKKTRSIYGDRPDISCLGGMGDTRRLPLHL